jgi:hypothetical protein
VALFMLVRWSRVEFITIYTNLPFSGWARDAIIRRNCRPVSAKLGGFDVSDVPAKCVRPRRF